jgi:hypothetical protein
VDSAVRQQLCDSFVRLCAAVKRAQYWLASWMSRGFICIQTNTYWSFYYPHKRYYCTILQLLYAMLLAHDNTQRRVHWKGSAARGTSPTSEKRLQAVEPISCTPPPNLFIYMAVQGNGGTEATVLLPEMISLPTARKTYVWTIQISCSFFIRRYIMRGFVICTLRQILLG